MELISVFNQSASTRIINIRLNQTVFLDPKHSKHKPFGQIFPINILKETQRKQTQILQKVLHHIQMRKTRSRTKNQLDDQQQSKEASSQIKTAQN